MSKKSGMYGLTDVALEESKQIAAHKKKMEEFENVKRNMFAIVYSDEGPNGPCGQSVETTSPHCSVYLFFSEESMRQWLKSQEDNMDKLRKARRKASWKVCHPKGHQDCTQLGMLVII